MTVWHGKVNDVFECPRCGGSIITTLGGYHKCPPNTAVGFPQTSGWVCPVCGVGNAPWVAQCGCQGHKGTVTVTGANAGSYDIAEGKQDDL